ncbi:MAG: hypothetical protein RTU30_01510 [Candidatus Thorarchaeota archaeon]
MLGRRLTKLVALMLIMTTILPTVVQAQGAHSLEWGVEDGEEYTYVLQRKTLDESGEVYISPFMPFISIVEEGEKVVIDFTLLQVIPSEIVDQQDEPRSYSNLTRVDGTESIVWGLTGFAVPIGDWSFLTQLRNLTNQAGVTVIDDSTHWGYIATGVLPEQNEVDVYNEVKYEKVNGTLAYMRWRFTTTTSTLIDIIFVQWHPGVPTILGPDLDLGTILLAGIGVCIALVCSFLTFKGYRSRRDLMEELGK